MSKEQGEYVDRAWHWYKKERRGKERRIAFSSKGKNLKRMEESAKQNAKIVSERLRHLQKTCDETEKELRALRQ